MKLPIMMVGKLLKLAVDLFIALRDGELSDDEVAKLVGEISAIVKDLEGLV